MHQTEGCQQCRSCKCGSILPDIFPKFIDELKAKSVSKRKKQKRESVFLENLNIQKMGRKLICS
jgi:hypothetical protein